MQPLSSDLQEFIHLLNTKSVKYVIVGAWALAFHGRPRYTIGDFPFNILAALPARKRAVPGISGNFFTTIPSRTRAKTQLAS